MKIFRTIAELRESLQPIRLQKTRIGFVPTMGALHRGHAVLVEQAHAECAHVVVSLFVNPLQFGPNEDYSRYPRSFDADVALCEKSGAQAIFAPDAAEMYPSPTLTFVEVSRVSEPLCGAFRPGHFRGVATVVLKLFNIVQPDVAYFGEKDYQQLCVIRRLVADLNLPVKITGVPTVREPDGLAMSSRNAYLKPQERKVAPRLYESLRLAKSMIEAGEIDAKVVKDKAVEFLAGESSIQVQYFEIVDPHSLESVDIINGPVRVASAVYLGATRLIDNLAANYANYANGTVIDIIGG